ncbi:MAG: OsmC family protein [Nakamurella sp.]
MTSDIAAESPGGARTDGLWAERVGTRLYTGHNARGAKVRMGPVEAGDVFTPGELLKIALAGCAGLSADHTLARQLGEEVAVTVYVAGIKHPGEERYPAIQEELEVDLSGLDRAALDRVLTVVKRAIDRNCTVGRTLEHSTDVSLTVTDAGIAGRRDSVSTLDAAGQPAAR